MQGDSLTMGTTEDPAKEPDNLIEANEERWLAAQYNLNSRTNFKYVRKLEGSELSQVRRANELLSFVVHRSPHQQVLDAILALDHSMGGSEKDARTVVDLERTGEALSGLVELVERAREHMGRCAQP